MTNKARTLATAEFNPDIKKYLLIYSILICVITVAGIVLIPIFLVAGPILIGKYFDRLSCELTTRSLRFEKGFIFHTERTIPLDKIQDLTFKEGPLLRAFGLSILKVETAGNTGQGTSDLTLIGIVDAADFRQKVLEQRDVVTDIAPAAAAAPGVHAAEGPGEVASLLREIRDALGRIEGKMDGE